MHLPVGQALPQLLRNEGHQRVQQAQELLQHREQRGLRTLAAALAGFRVVVHHRLHNLQVQVAELLCLFITIKTHSHKHINTHTHTHTELDKLEKYMNNKRTYVVKEERVQSRGHGTEVIVGERLAALRDGHVQARQNVQIPAHRHTHT
jgi:hypothetical protein